MGFAPYATDEWKEYWFPVKKTRGFVKANPYGALNIKKENGWLKIFFSPLQSLRDSLKVMEGGKPIYLATLDLKPMESFADSIRSAAGTGNLEVLLGDHKLDYRTAADADTLGRPLESPTDFDWNSVYGLCLQGKEDIRQRFYSAASLKLKACLAKNPDYLPALDELGSLQFRNLEYRAALVTIKKALSVDTYDPAANYYYGLINVKLGNITDARDGFDIASMSVEYRSPAFLELARICFRGKDLAEAMRYAGKCLTYNQLNLDALQLQATIYRLQNDRPNAMQLLDELLRMDPLSHFAAFEKYLWHDTDEKAFQQGIKNELPSETYLDLGIWYAQLGLRDDARKVFALAPRTAEICYWKAFLDDKPVEIIHPEPGYPFPYRAETAAVLESLIRKNSEWHLKYHLALIWWSRNQLEKAKELFSACGNQPDYAAFYAAKASLFPAEEESDLKRAISMDGGQWRYTKLLTDYFIRKEKFPAARALVEPFYLTHSSNYILGMLYAKTLLLNKQYAKADTLLTRLDVIPFEGATDGRRLYEEAKLMQAVAGIKNHRYKDALAFVQAAGKWPGNLGVGKPYAEDIDERPGNRLNYLCYHFLGDNVKAREALIKIVHFTTASASTAGNSFSANTLITAWALDKLNRREEALHLLDRWIRQNPDNKTAVWSKQVFENPHTAVPEEIRKNEMVRILEELIIDN
jgi:tetratricopeptide (TPR) repeat protein